MLMRLLFLLLFALAGLAHAEEPLPPEQAFRFSARAIDAKTIEARWQITDQYYMYRDKFRFVLDGGTLGAPKLPPGKVKEDEIFGKVETYRKEVKILLPVEATGTVTLKAVSQGCWDGGICYPPINQEARIELIAAAGTPSAIDAASPAPSARDTAPGSAGGITPAAKPSLPQPNVVNADAIIADRPEQRVPMTRLRARVAERLVQSQSTNAILTTFNEVNMAPVMEMRKKYQEKFEKEHGVKLGFMSFFVKAAVAALKKYPVINSSVDGNDIVYHGYFDIGIAVGSPRGLVVPILRDADQMSLAQIEKKIAEFGAKAKDGKLSLEDLSGGTFSISNGGTFGSMLSTPIINPPQSAILGVHATKDRAVVENGQIVIRPINYLALSYDHRIIDGREAVLGLVTMKEALEDPARLLLDV
jgi:2-oxoglutarate dehydrogenase E2 component (dihydrolipoamide succinyltransferase)